VDQERGGTQHITERSEPMFKVTTYNTCAMCGHYGVGRTMMAAYRQMLKKASKQFITYRNYGGKESSDLDGYAQVEEQFIAARKLMARSKTTRASATDGWRVLTVEIERL
jgi:hypothetical protein